MNDLCFHPHGTSNHWPPRSSITPKDSLKTKKRFPSFDRNLLSADAGSKVGFADRTLGKALPSHQTRQGKQLRKFLQGVGILKPTGHETFRGYVTVPLMSLQGETTGIYGVRIDRNGAGEKIITIGNGIFNAAAFHSFDEIIVCDCVLDAWTFYAAGYKNAIAAGAIQLRQEHFANVKRALLAHPNIDCDPFVGKELLRINFPDDTSVNQYAIDNTSIDDCLGQRIRAAFWINGAPPPSQVERSETVAPSNRQRPQRRQSRKTCRLSAAKQKSRYHRASPLADSLAGAQHHDRRVESQRDGLQRSQ